MQTKLSQSLFSWGGVAKTDNYQNAFKSQPLHVAGSAHNLKAAQIARSGPTQMMLGSNFTLQTRKTELAPNRYTKMFALKSKFMPAPAPLRHLKAPIAVPKLSMNMESKKRTEYRSSVGPTMSEKPSIRDE